MTAPATAPIGPSTTAPDTAPKAASPARSPALAAEDISARESATLAIVFFNRVPPVFLRKQYGSQIRWLCKDGFMQAIRRRIKALRVFRRFCGSHDTDRRRQPRATGRIVATG